MTAVTASQVVAQDGREDQTNAVVEGLTISDLQADLQTRHTRYLDKLIRDATERDTYLRGVLTNRSIEANVAERGLADEQMVLEQLRTARQRVLLDALVLDKLKESETNIREVARERYLANPDQYKVRKKIKIAVIFVAKSKEEEPSARELVEEIAAQLDAAPDDGELFHALAKQHSDDVKAADGGKIKEWLIAPHDLERRDPVMQAAFALETVGETTPIVETESGYSIIKLMDVTPEFATPFEAVASSIEEEVRRELFAITRAEVYAGLSPGEDLRFDDEQLLQRIRETYEARTGSAVANE